MNIKFTTTLLSILTIVSSSKIIRGNVISTQYFDDAVPCETPDENGDCGVVYINHEDAQACKKSIKEALEDCQYPTVEIKSLDELCQKFQSSTCQDFFNLPVSSLSGCKKLSATVLENYESLKDKHLVAYTLKCSKDDEGAYCPLSSFNLYENTRGHGLRVSPKVEVEDDAFAKAIHQSCESKACYKTAIKAFSLFNANINHALGKRSSIIKSKNEEEDGFTLESEHTITNLNSNYCLQQMENVAGERIKTDSSEQVVHPKNNTNTIQNNNLLASQASPIYTKGVHFIMSFILILFFTSYGV